MTITIRPATADDMDGVHALVRELAAFESGLDKVVTSPEQFRRDAFDSEFPWFFALVAEHEADGIVGIAVCHRVYSTWRGRMIHLEDLVVKETHRRQGIGGALMDAVFEQAKREGATSVKWQVLNWNEGAIRKYESVGAEIDKDWYDCRKIIDQSVDYTKAA